MKKPIIFLSLVCYMHIAAIAQNSVSNYKTRYADSCYRIQELQSLVQQYQNTCADLQTAIELRAAINEFRIGRTEGEKLDQQNENDKLQTALVIKRDNLARILKQRSTEWKNKYEHKNR